MSPIKTGLEMLLDQTYRGHLVKQVEVRTDLQRDQLVGEVVLAMIETNDPPRTFVRSGQLTRVVTDEDGRPGLQTVSDDATMRTVLLSHVRLMRLVKRDGEFVHESIWMPRELVQTVRTLGRYGELPAIEAIAEAPTMRRDGTILDTPGYDAASRLIYHPADGLDVPAVADDPTAEQLAAAVNLLRSDLLGEFPFATAADEANALALLLTPIIRPSLRTVPLALVTAPRAGTGKGLLASVAARVATGRAPGVFPAPTADEEWGKAILSMLAGGTTFILIDEAKELRSPPLAAALTADVYEGRRLGHTEQIRVPQRATWVAAGNNVELGGDLPRRVYAIRLDPKVSRPWTRNGWRHPDLEGWAADNRGRLLHALLTIARAWHAAGRPKGKVPTLGGFSDWANTVGGMLHHAGVHGFLANLADLYDQADDEANEWEGFLTALRDATNGERFVTGDVVRALSGNHTLRDALPDDLTAKLQTPGFSRALGKALKAKLDTRHGDHGLHVASAGRDGHSKAPLWIVATDQVAGFAVSCGVSTPETLTRTLAPARTYVGPHSPQNPANPANENPACGTGAAS
ncbi:MAG: hypothetical protein WKF96_21610 [Solirubrobacteraceae bacterium]